MRGGITIYISLMLVLILALIFTLMESGRVSAIRARAESCAFMAADSVFAEFAQPVYDRYGVMFLWTDEEGFLKKFDSYIEKTLDLSGSGAGSDLDLYGLAYEGSSLGEVKRITDNGGSRFLKQVLEYMKIHAVEGIAETLLSKSDLFRQTEKTREIFGKINSLQGGFSKVEEGVAKIYDTTQRIKDLSENPRSILDELEQLMEDEDADAETVKKRLAEKEEEWNQTEKQLKKEVSGLQKETETYYQNVSESKDAVTEIQEAIDLKEEDYDPEIYRTLKSRLSRFEDLGLEEGEGYRTIAANAKEAEDWLNNAEQMEAYFSQAKEALEAEDLEEAKRLTGELKGTLAAPNLVVTETAGGDSLSEKPSAGFIRKVNKQYKKGLLDFFADEISEKQVEKKEVPSETCDMKNTSDENSSFAEQTLEKALFCEYIREHFNCFTYQKRDTVLDYEAEYILAGKDNDRDNLSTVVGELVLLRTGTNMLSLMSDGEKMAQIEELALAIAGATTQLYLAKIAEMVILMAWSLAESMLDVRALLEGKKVAILKKEGDWNFSLAGLQNYTGEESSTKENPTGLDYREYLLMLLMLQGKQKQIFRTMDVIQMNMCDEENDAFRIKDCIAEVRAEAGFSAPGVFTALPPVRQLLAEDAGSYQFQCQQAYAY